MILTYDSEAGTVTVDGMEPLKVANPGQAMEVFQAATKEIMGPDRGAETETLVNQQSQEIPTGDLAEKEEETAMMVAAGENPKNPGKNQAGYEGSY